MSFYFGFRQTKAVSTLRQHDAPEQPELVARVVFLVQGIGSRGCQAQGRGVQRRADEAGHVDYIDNRRHSPQGQGVQDAEHALVGIAVHDLLDDGELGGDLRVHGQAAVHGKEHPCADADAQYAGEHQAADRAAFGDLCHENAHQDRVGQREGHKEDGPGLRETTVHQLAALPHHVLSDGAQLEGLVLPHIQGVGADNADQRVGKV